MGSIGAPELIVLALGAVFCCGGLVGAVALVRALSKGSDKLVECRDCKRRISKRATACPGCGAPVGG